MTDTKIFLDTEFTGLRQDTSLVSLALVAEDERSLYVEFNDFDRSQVDDWIAKNVITNLALLKDQEFASPQLKYAYSVNERSSEYLTKKIVFDEEMSAVALIEVWLSQFVNVQIVSDCPAYDWVLFCGLWGNALEMPGFISPVCHDINQDLARHFKVSDREAFNLIRENIAFESPDHEADKFSGRTGVKSPKHNALWDAIVIKGCWEKLNKRNA